MSQRIFPDITKRAWDERARKRHRILFPREHDIIDQSSEDSETDSYRSRSPIAVNELIHENDPEFIEIDELFEDTVDQASETVPTLRESLKKWVMKWKLQQEAVDELLSKLLRPAGHTDLPSSYKTLCDTPTDKLITKSVPPGQMYHFGLKKIILELEEKLELSKTNAEAGYVILHQRKHIDGVSLADSSSLKGIYCNLR